MGNTKSLNNIQSDPQPSSLHSYLPQNKEPAKKNSQPKTHIQQPPQSKIKNLFDEVPNLHKPKTYKKPVKELSKDQNNLIDSNDNDEEEIQSHMVELYSEKYKSCSFLDPEYVKSLPIVKKGKDLKIDETKTMFFKAGPCPVYSDTIYILADYDGESEESLWAALDEPDYMTTMKVTYAYNLRAFNLSEENRKYLMQAGWVVMYKNKWGFLLNLEALSEAYDGLLHNRWKVLLKEPFFLDMLNIFGEYIAELQDQSTGNFKKYHVFKELPTTDFDPVIPEEYLPVNLHSTLFLHQKQEVGWMFNLENYPALNIAAKDKYIRFLDTGYYINPEDLSAFVKKTSNDEITGIIVPGGILASQIGSGKTVTTIALASIGTQFRGLEENKYEEESKINDPSGDGRLKYLMDGVYEPTLIIVTQNILGQWGEEFRKFAPNLRVAVIETDADIISLQFQKKNYQTILVNYDVILTHRKIIEEGEELFKRYCPEIFEVSFRRVMMDEFHELTTYFTEQAQHSGSIEYYESKKKLDMLKFYKTLNRIDRRFTWGITGTPDNLNYYAEINPMFKLLGLGQQYDQFKQVFKNNDEFIMTCMRKNPRSVDLPGLKKSIKEVVFGQIQNILYRGKLAYAKNKYAAQEICSHMMKQFRQLVGDGNGLLQIAIKNIQKKHQEEIEKVLLQIQVNPHERRYMLRLETLQSEGNFFDEVIQVMSQETFSCPICFDDCEAEKIVITGCLHTLCVACYEQLNQKLIHFQCPICREYIRSRDLIIHPKFSSNEGNKLAAIIEAIEETPKEDKVIIFTQFHNLVEHLSELFSSMGIQYMVLRGEPSDINISLAKFKTNPDLKILLMSVEQAASGINVQEANHVFFAHPVFGMEFEKAAITYNQCIGRAYRIGQMKKVDVKLFITSDSLESDFVPSFTKYSHSF